MNTYEIITNKIIEMIEKENLLPWQKPWIGGGTPRNLVSKREYRGINIFLLGLQNYSSPYWASFKQIKDAGGFVKTGERASIAIFWKVIVKESGMDESGEVIVDKFPMMRYYNVFNTDQCTDLKIPELKRFEHSGIEEAQLLVDSMPNAPSIKIGCGRACYNTIIDEVEVPAIEQYEIQENYYSSLFHELIHSTGHQKRLNRKEITEFDMLSSNLEDYGKEELVAEMGAAMLCGVAGINSTIQKSSSYVKGWMEKIKGDPKLLICAASLAQKAVDYIRNTKFEKKEEK